VVNITAWNPKLRLQSCTAHGLEIPPMVNVIRTLKDFLFKDEYLSDGQPGNFQPDVVPNEAEPDQPTYMNQEEVRFKMPSRPFTSRYFREKG